MIISTRIIIFIIFGISFGVDLFFLITNVYNDPQMEERDKLRPKEGISIGHSENMRMYAISFYVVNTRLTDSIMVRYDTTFINSEDEGKIGIFFPYNVKLTSDESEWEKMNFNTGTAFLKKYSCNPDEYCKINYFEEYMFELIPEKSKFDSKNGYKHGMQIKVDHVVSDQVDKFFREFNVTENYPLRMSYDETVKRHITIVIPEDADNIHPIPIPDPDIFHNSNLDYSNTQLDWHILKDSQVIFLDYELPDERKRFDNTQTNISLTGIIMGIIVGLFGISIAIESTRKQTRMKIGKYGDRG